MLDKILYNLIYIEDNQDIKIDILDRLKQLPKNILNQNDKKIITILDMIIKSGKNIDKKTFNTYLSFYKEFDSDEYFWNTNEKEAIEIDLQTSVKLFIKEKLTDLNTKRLEEITKKYKETGDETLLSEIELNQTEDKEYVHDAKEFMRRTMVKFDNIKNGTDTETLNFSNKFFYLQMVTKGLEMGEFILIAARPSVGKTAFGLALLNDFSKTKNVLYISYEMTMEEIGMRMIQAKAGITKDTIYSKDKFDNERYQQIYMAQEEMSKQGIKIIDEPPNNFLKLREVIRKEKRKSVDLVIIDYLGLIRAYGPNDKWDPYLTTSQVSADMKLLAKELRIPIIALQQVNRAVSQGTREEASTRELQLTDLRDSGGLEQDANKVFLMWNKKAENDEEKKRYIDGDQDLILFLAKNRGGKANQKFLYKFLKNTQRLIEVKWLTAPSSWNDGGKKND